MPPGIMDTSSTDEIDSGTMCRHRASVPSPWCGSAGGLCDLESSLNLLQTEANNFGMRFIANKSVRQEYIRKTVEIAKIIKEEVEFGRLTPYEGALEANKLRNSVLDAARLNSSDIGRAEAEALKASGKTLQQLEKHYAEKIFGKAFQELNQTQKNQVWLEVVEASGRPNPGINSKALRLAKVGKGFIVISAAIAVYNITTAEDKSRQTAKEGVTTGAGMLGGMAGGAAAGLACGPGAPVCVTVGVFIGGIAATLGADFAFENLW